MISGEQIEQKPSVKYLGVHIDNKLKRKNHIKAVASKVTRAIAMIRHSRKSPPPQAYAKDTISGACGTSL